MPTFLRFSLLAVAGLLLLSTSGCDYTAPKGGTLETRLTSTTSDLNKAVVTVEQISVASIHNGSGREHFGRGTNMLEENVEVDLTTLKESGGTLLSSDQVPPGDFNQLHVALADTALISYDNKNGQSTETEVVLSDERAGNVVITFDPILLKTEDERGTMTLEFDADRSFLKSKGTGTFQFTPTVTAKALVVNGSERALTQ